MILFHRNLFDTVVCKFASIFSRPQCSNGAGLVAMIMKTMPPQTETCLFYASIDINSFYLRKMLISNIWRDFKTCWGTCKPKLLILTTLNCQFAQRIQGIDPIHIHLDLQYISRYRSHHGYYSYTTATRDYHREPPYDKGMPKQPADLGWALLKLRFLTSLFSGPFY